MDNRRQSLPKAAYGLGWYGHTLATQLLGLVLNVARQDHAEYSIIKYFRVISYSLGVPIKPYRDFRRAELCTE